MRRDPRIVRDLTPEEIEKEIARRVEAWERYKKIGGIELELFEKLFVEDGKLIPPEYLGE